MNEPLIGYRNLITPGSINAESEVPGSPASNMGYPTTNEIWRSATTDSQLVAINLGGTPRDFDYIGIARHNLCSAQIPITVQVSSDGDTWDTVFGPAVVGCIGPALIRFDKVTASQITILFEPTDTPPEIGVMYLGELLRLPRRIYVGHTPIKYGRSANVVTGRSENGSFLGRIIKNESRSTQISMGNIPPGFYREHIDPWLQSALENPFFFSWRPDTYPDETGYVWATNDPSMSNQRPNGMVEFSLRVNGIAY